MTKRPLTVAAVEPDSLHARYNDIAFSEVDAVMRNYGAGAKTVADEYQLRAVHKALKVWNVGREEARAIVVSRASQSVDVIFDSYQAEPSHTGIVDIRDVVRRAEEAAYAAAQSSRPQDVGLKAVVWAVVDVESATRPLIHALGIEGLGEFNPLDCTWIVPASSFAADLPHQAHLQQKVADAFAAVIRAQGIIIGTRTITSSEDHQHG